MEKNQVNTDTTAEQKEANIFEIDGLIKEIYNDVAKWHNDDTTKEGLKKLTIDIIELVSRAAFDHMGLKIGEVSVYQDEETKEKIKKIKELKNSEQV